MTVEEARRLAELARRFGVTPEQVLVAAAVMAENAELRAADVLARLRDAHRSPSPARARVFAMLRSPPSASAPAHVEDALAMLWRRGADLAA